MGRPWDIIEYGLCCIEDMLAEIPTTTITVSIVHRVAMVR